MLYEVTSLRWMMLQLLLPCNACAGIAALFCEGSAYGLYNFKADLAWLSKQLIIVITD